MARTFLRRNWWIAAVTSLVLLIGPVAIALRSPALHEDPARAHLPVPSHHVDHSTLMTGPFPDGPAVTATCLKCHPGSAREVMGTTHWTWESDSLQMVGRSSKVTLGKKQGFNNFCISISGGNWTKCTSCHAGYGWKDAQFDFGDSLRVDCLACHDQSGQYAKGNSGEVADGVDLVAAAKSVGRPTRQNCGSCHFKGGGGNAVKHGDLDGSLYHPAEGLDVHMGLHGMECVDCHQTQHHRIEGRAMSVNTSRENRLECTDCHDAQPHGDERLDGHTRNIACQTCHIPAVALKTATKTHWDWATAGRDTSQDAHSYLKIKGSFQYAKNLVPEYRWYNGDSWSYVKGDKLVLGADSVALINRPLGDLRDPTAKIHPFKVHRARQLYDTVNDYLLPPNTAGDGGFWKEFDWNRAASLGAAMAGLPYSGSFGFVRTEMSWPLDHMVAPAEQALQCLDCHAESGRMDWKALGYTGDPMRSGLGREALR